MKSKEMTKIKQNFFTKIKDFFKRIFLKKHKDIKNCYNLYSTPVGYKYFVVFTIAVDGNMTTYESHKLANHLEKDVEALDKIYKAVVHVHPDNMLKR